MSNIGTRICGTCGRPGHNKRGCTANMRTNPVNMRTGKSHLPTKAGALTASQWHDIHEAARHGMKTTEIAGQMNLVGNEEEIELCLVTKSYSDYAYE